MTFHICIVYHLFFVSAGKMTEGSRITPPYWAASQLHHHWKLAVLQEGPTTTSSSSWPALPLPRCCNQHSQTTLCPRRGDPLQHRKTQGWLSPGAVLHHGYIKNPAGSARVGVGIKPSVWCWFIPNTGESRGCRSRGKYFMIAVSKCSSNHL